MKLSKQARQELLDFSHAADFSPLKKVQLAEKPGTREATNQFTEFIQLIHKMANHPKKEHKPITGTFLL